MATMPCLSCLHAHVLVRVCSTPRLPVGSALPPQGRALEGGQATQRGGCPMCLTLFSSLATGLLLLLFVLTVRLHGLHGPTKHPAQVAENVGEGSAWQASAASAGQPRPRPRARPATVAVTAALLLTAAVRFCHRLSPLLRLACGGRAGTAGRCQLPPVLRRAQPRGWSRTLLPPAPAAGAAHTLLHGLGRPCSATAPAAAAAARQACRPRTPSVRGQRHLALAAQQSTGSTGSRSSCRRAPSV